jgi:hypothetical protein
VGYSSQRRRLISQKFLANGNEGGITNCIEYATLDEREMWMPEILEEDI